MNIRKERRVLRISDQADKHPRLEEGRTVSDREETIYHCADIIGQNWRKVENWIGWVPVAKQDAPEVLTKDSFLTFYLRSLAVRGSVHSPGCSPSKESIKHVQNLRSILLPYPTGTPPHPSENWLKSLSTSSRRHLDMPNLGKNYDLLKRSGWLPPREGTVMEAHDWHPRLGGDLWVVVSNDRFNASFYYPEIVIIPLTRLPQDTEVDDARASGMIVIGPIAHHGELLAWPSHVRSFSFTNDYHGPCGRCYKPRHRPAKWRIEGGPAKGHCLHCNPHKSDESVWPKISGLCSPEDLAIIREALIKQLELVDQ